MAVISTQLMPIICMQLFFEQIVAQYYVLLYIGLHDLCSIEYYRPTYQCCLKLLLEDGAIKISDKSQKYHFKYEL